MNLIDPRRPVLNRLTLLIATSLSAGPAVPIQAASSFASASATVYPPPTSVMDSLAAVPVTIVSASGAVILRIVPATPSAEPSGGQSTPSGSTTGSADGPRAVAMVNPGTPGEASPTTLTDFNRLVADGGTLRGGLVGSMSVQAPSASVGAAGSADFHVTVAFN
jgi:hypothetical protein